MNYRIQDFFKLVIPGLYVIASIVLYYWDSLDVARIDKVSDIVIVLIPFVGFVFGYVIECIMAMMEHLAYCLGARRPSKTILSGSQLYYLSNREQILKRFSAENKLTNKTANEILQTAKQAIQSEKVENYWLSVCVSRNLFGAQILGIIICAVLDESCWQLYFVQSLIALMFCMYWIHTLHVYVKYVLSEYGKEIVK